MGTLYENIVVLCNERGIKGGKLCTDIGISKGLLTDLKMGRRSGVSAETAQKIAAYFDVSVGYLLGKENKKAPTEAGERDILDDVDVAFYGDFKELSDDEKETVRDMVRLMRQRKEKRSQ